MANSKISALTSATTPLAGTEVLPIVQSSATVKVATNDLTVRNVRANATTGILQVTGPAAASTRVMTTPDANFTAARTDAAQSFTGDQTLSTGNVVQGTAGKGINFTANTPASGMTSQLLNWYEEGTWTPTDGSGAGLSFSSASGSYVRIGRQVTLIFSVTYPGTANTSSAKLGGLPFSASTGNLASGGYITYTSYIGTISLLSATSTANFYNGNSVALTNTNLGGRDIRGVIIYMI